MKQASLRLSGPWSLASAAAVGWLVTSLGCVEPPAGRMNAPPQGYSLCEHPLGDNYVHMTDNAMLADMSVSSVHFVPHSMELNSLGVRRLKRYAPILKVYGGTLHYDGNEQDDELRANRMGQIRKFLLACGLETDAFAVEEGLAGGAGLRAAEASEIRKAKEAELELYRAHVDQASEGGSSGS